MYCLPNIGRIVEDWKMRTSNNSTRQTDQNINRSQKVLYVLSIAHYCDVPKVEHALDGDTRARQRISHNLAMTSQ